MATTLLGSECKFAIHIPARKNSTPDIHLVKETLHYSDGTTKPNIRFVKDFKRSVYIANKTKQNHQQKKEYEQLDNLLTTSVTQSELRNEVAKLLGKSWSNDSLRKLNSSPYIYGTDITSTSLIKHAYQTKYPDLNSKYSVATFDIETDVINGTRSIILATIAFEDKVFTAVLKDFIRGFSSLQDRFQSAVTKYIGEYTTKYNMKPELYVAEDVVELIRAVFDKAHQWKPDLLAIWNIDYDIPFVLRVLEENKVDPKSILCDPSVPQELRICKYKQGPKKKVTASGKVIPINPAGQWHTLFLTSSFYVIDAMCVYKQLRLNEQEQPSYSLDAILNKELGIRKLKFEEANQYHQLKWHQVMQSEYKIEYMVYNIFDCVSMLELDNKTRDLSYTLGSFAATTDFSNFKSQPRRITDALHFFLLERGYVLASMGGTSFGEEEEEEVDETLGLSGWVVTLPAHLMVPGLPYIAEDPTMCTNIRCFVFDSDAVAAYPTATSVANVSKGTTKRELIDVSGIDGFTFRMQNLNLLVGPVNAIEYSTTMFNMKKPDELLKSFQASLN